MIGPRASGPRNVAREVVPERGGRAKRISSFDMAMRWVTPAAGARCVITYHPEITASGFASGQQERMASTLNIKKSSYSVTGRRGAKLIEVVVDGTV